MQTSISLNIAADKCYDINVVFRYPCQSVLKWGPFAFEVSILFCSGLEPLKKDRKYPWEPLRRRRLSVRSPEKWGLITKRQWRPFSRQGKKPAIKRRHKSEGAFKRSSSEYNGFFNLILQLIVPWSVKSHQHCTKTKSQTYKYAFFALSLWNIWCRNVDAGEVFFSFSTAMSCFKISFVLPQEKSAHFAFTLGWASFSRFGGKSPWKLEVEFQKTWFHKLARLFRYFWCYSISMIFLRFAFSFFCVLRSYETNALCGKERERKNLDVSGEVSFFIFFPEDTKMQIFWVKSVKTLSQIQISSL